VRSRSRLSEQEQPLGVASNCSRFHGDRTFDDMAYTPVDKDPRWAPFVSLREYLFSTFPTVYCSLLSPFHILALWLICW
jgi:hypothetical protein